MSGWGIPLQSGGKGGAFVSWGATVIGWFELLVSAERSVDVLVSEGIESTDVSFLASQESSGASETGVVLRSLAGVGLMAIPGLGSFVAAGPLLARISANPVGGLVGTLVTLGFPEPEAKNYERRVRQGGALVLVHCATPKISARVREIMKRTGAIDIASTAELREKDAKHGEAIDERAHERDRSEG